MHVHHKKKLIKTPPQKINKQKEYNKNELKENFPIHVALTTSLEGYRIINIIFCIFSTKKQKQKTKKS